MSFKPALILLLFIAVGSASGQSVGVISSGASGLELDLTFSRPETASVWIGGARYHRLRMAGCTNLLETGMPALPQKSFLVAVPPNCAVSAVVIPGGRETWQGIKPEPAGGLNDGSDRAATPGASYRERKEYPGIGATVSGPAWIGRQKVATVTVYPVSWLPIEDRLSFYPSMRLSIRFVPSPRGEMPFPSGPDRTDRAEGIVIRHLVNVESSAEWTCLPQDAPAKGSTISSDTLPYKIMTEADGLYRVDYHDLVAAGVNPALFDPRTLHLYHRGREEAVYFFGQEDGIFDLGDYFEFWGQRARGDSTYYHFHTDSEVYYLGFGGALGSRMVEEDAAPSAPAPAGPELYRDTLHLEHDSSFVRLKRRESDQSDRWFWRRVDQGDSLVATFDLPGLKPALPESITIYIRIHGYTYIDTGATPDHGIEVVINGYALPAATFDGQAPFTYQQSFPSSCCRPSANRIVVRHSAVPYSIDSYLINWIDVSYPRGYQADGDKAVFRRPSGIGDTLCQFTVGGFSNHLIDVYKLGTSKLVGSAISPGPTGLDYEVTFQDLTFGPARYLAVAGGGQARLRPSAIIPNRASDLRPSSNRGDYLIIAPDTLRGQATALAASRAAQFSSAKVALTSDIYDEFGGGLASDLAIKRFIQHAYDSWSSPPRYVLLMGEGSYDPKNLLGSSRPDLVPAHFTRTDDFGPVADDNWYACVSGTDLLPDISVGRLAVSTVGQYATWEAKRNFYENSPMVDQWRRDFMVVAGWPLQSGDDFYTPSDELARSLDDRFTVSKVYHGRWGGTTQNIIDQFNEGSAAAVYYGHGGGQVWSHSTFFTNSDVPRLNNWGRWPFITAATCYCGAFEVPDTTSLAQELLRAQGGAIGVLASSGPSWGNIMEWTFAEAIDGLGLRRFGDIALSAKYQLAGGLPPSGYIAEMMNSFNLLGDPGTWLALADTGLRAAVSPASVIPGDSLGLSLSGPFPASSIGLFSLADSADTVRLQRAFSTPQAGQSLVILAGDSGLATGDYRARVYLKQGSRDWAASTVMAVGRPSFSGFRTLPARPNDLDSIWITALAASRDGIDSVWCQYSFGPRYDTLAAGIAAMVPGGGDSFVLAAPLAPAGYQPYLNYRLALADTLGRVWRSAFQSCRIWRRPDLLPDPYVTPLAMGGNRRLSLIASVRNQGETDAVGVPVHFFLGENDSLIGISLVDTLPAGKTAKAELFWPHGEERRPVYFIVDPSGAIWPPDQDTSNNRSAQFTVPVEPFFYRQLGAAGGSGDTVRLRDGSRFRWHLPDSCLDDSAVAFYAELSIDNSSPYYPSLQPGLAPLDTNLPYSGLIVGFCDSSLGLLPGRSLFVAISDSGLDSARMMHGGIYCQGQGSGRHKLVRGAHPSGWFSGNSESVGLFSLLYKADTAGPAITARVDRRATGWGNYVRTNSQLYHILAEDPDGVDPSSVRIRQDGIEMPASAYSVDRNPADPRSVPVLFPASLGEGHHLLEFEAADLLGNRSAIRDELDVLLSFGLYEVANYPNPVDGDLTTFYFLVGDHADRWRTDIYTIAGRHLRTLEGGYASGVHTFDWDLTDRDGRRVANGVYFYVMTVWSDERSEKRTGKLAILR